MADLGRKHVCFKCAAKFYDLKKPKALCPKCGADQADAPVVVPPPPPPVKRTPRIVDPVEPEPEAEEETEIAAEADEDDLEVETDEPVGFEEVEDKSGEDSYD